MLCYVMLDVSLLSMNSQCACMQLFINFAEALVGHFAVTLCS